MIDFDVTYDFECEWLPILRLFEVIEFEMTPNTVFFEKKMINLLLWKYNFSHQATLAWVPKNSNNGFQFAICTIKLF